MHAREWIAPASCRYFVHSVLAAASGEFVASNLPYTDSDLAALLDFNWYIIVSCNPDGYQYTHTDDRMWRKNRADIGQPFCMGVDLNRNFPVGWQTAGGSTSPCVYQYAGAAPLDQIESAAWDQWIKDIRGNNYLSNNVRFS